MPTFRDILTKMFTRNVVVKHLPGGRLKTFDVQKTQITGGQSNTTTHQNRMKWRNGRNFNTTSGYGSGFTNEEVEGLRKQMYVDYELMDTDAIISSVLDIYADETANNSIDGELLVIKTSNERIKAVLHNLFYDILDVEFNLWSWVRTMCKYGDGFLYLEIRENLGVVNVLPIHPSLMIRMDGTPENPDQVVFRYEGDGGFYSQHNIFQDFEIAHFRLLTDTNYLPYGRSIIEGSKKAFKSLSLMEEAMMLHRIMRAPERRVYKIDIGNIAPEEVDAHMENIIKEMKKTPYIDPQTGQLNLAYNMMPVAWYTNIPLLDGRTITIKELSDEIKSGSANWVYSIDPDTHDIVPGKVSWCDITKKDADIVRVTLDDYSYIDFEPSHPVMLRDGSYLAAKDLINGQSLMPFYTDKTNQKRMIGYETVYNPSTDNFKVTHRVVSTKLNIDDYNNTKNVVHHKDFRKLNNSPENLDCTMDYREHIGFHYKNAIEFWASKTPEERNEINKKRSETHKERFRNGAIQWSYGLTKDTCPSLQRMADKMSRENNPERAKKISDHHTGIPRPEHSIWMKENMIPYERTPEFRNTLSEARTGDKNAMFGKTWEEIHGEELANIRKERARETFKAALEGYIPSESELQRRSEFMTIENKQRWENPEYKQRVGDAMKDRFDDYLFNRLIYYIKLDNELTCKKLIDKLNSEDGLYDYYLNLNAGRQKPNKFKLQVIQRAYMNRGYKSYPEFKKSVINDVILNHKVLSVEYLTEKLDVYCMTIDDYHNFAIDSHEGTSRNGIFVKNSSMDDYFLPVRGGESGTDISTLAGLGNDGQTDDVEYLKDKLLASVKIPKEYLGYGDDGSRASLSQSDVRFARTIERIQKIFVSELYKIAIVHLHSQGFESNELLDFELFLTNPSLIFERQKTDALVAKVDLVKSIKESNLFSDQYIYENIFGLSEDVWEADRERVVEDLKHAFRLKQIIEQGNDPKESGKSIGTPWDIASLQVSSKLDVHNQKSLKSLYTPDEREENEGRPETTASSFETRRDKDFGRDPVGRRAANQTDIPKQTEQTINRILKTLNKKKKETGILNENQLFEDDI